MHYNLQCRLKLGKFGACIFLTFWSKKQYNYPPFAGNPSIANEIIVLKEVVSKETVVLRRWGGERNVWFINRVET